MRSLSFPLGVRGALEWIGCVPLKSAAHKQIDHFSLHADTWVAKHNRKGLEKLCRYAARPPVCASRLEKTSDGRYSYSLKHRWSDGTSQAVFMPHQLLARLASMVPAPRAHQVRYHGVLASAASLRSFVVPAGGRICRKDREANACWSELMKRAFELDVLECPRCLGPMRFIACIMSRDAIAAILGTTGMPGGSPQRS